METRALFSYLLVFIIGYLAAMIDMPAVKNIQQAMIDMSAVSNTNHKVGIVLWDEK